MLGLKDELIGLEKQFWQTMVDKDVDAALKLTHDPCIVAGAQGVSRIGKEKFAEMMRMGDWTLHKYELRDVEVEELTDDVAIVGYKVREELTVGGEPLVVELADASTWVRENGSWLCALHTESVAGDPFGRDRRPAAPAG